MCCCCFAPAAGTWTKHFARRGETLDSSQTMSGHPFYVVCCLCRNSATNTTHFLKNTIMLVYGHVRAELCVLKIPGSRVERKHIRIVDLQGAPPRQTLNIDIENIATNISAASCVDLAEEIHVLK